MLNMLIILFIAAHFLAFSNGANDNFKGAAALFGSKTTYYKGAITWAAVTILTGSIAAIFTSNNLTANFSRKGLVPDVLIQAPEIDVSIAFEAAATVYSATKSGMPISTALIEHFI